MTETARLSMPFLAPSQAQKHVTVNEALARLDAAVQMTVRSRTLAVPPAAANDGDTFLVPEGAVNAWAGRSGEVAVRQNGGWIFLRPQPGWRAFVESEAVFVLHDGEVWRDGIIALSPGGAATRFVVVELDHVIGSGPVSTTAPVIPPDMVVFGVTGRVVQGVTGSLGAWRLGVADSSDRYGSGLGLLEGSWVRGVTGTPLTYYSATELLLTAEGGDFASGLVRLAVHGLMLDFPRIGS